MFRGESVSQLTLNDELGANKIENRIDKAPANNKQIALKCRPLLNANTLVPTIKLEITTLI